MDLQPYADIVLKGKALFTSCSDSLMNGFIAIKGNRIAAVGDYREAIDWIGTETKVYEFDHQLIMPGFSDSHVHTLYGAIQLDSICLGETNSEEEAAKAVYEHYKDRNDEWIFGFEWACYFWDVHKLPTKESLDYYFPDRPVCLFNEELHGVWVNSKALEICNITKDTPDPEMGTIYRKENGEPAGYLLETAASLVTSVALKFSPEKLKQMMENYFKTTASMGITSVSDVQIFNTINYDVHAQLEKENKLTTRVHFAVPIVTEIEEVKALREKYKSDRLMFAGTKEFIDGTPLGRTGFMLELYDDEPDNIGRTMMDLDVLKEYIIKMDREGIRVRLHACGDAAVRFGLDAYEEAQRLNGVRDSRHTLEHLELIHPDDLPRLEKLGVIPSVQPDHLHVKKYADHPFHKLIGEKRNKYAWAFKSMLNHGGKLALGTDNPISDINPFLTIYRAVTRLHEDRQPEGGWLPEEKLTMAETLKAYTIGSAYQNFREKDLGTLEAGKLADIIVLDRNLFSVDSEEIRDTKVILTVMDGQIIHEMEEELNEQR